ncbi:hypothetical protein [Streptomyces sp. UG1]|uniref:hypothetical protein n=1 Tax=Streptomyces sp. UG1 TaxID=3417652 RepID=UPI003CF23966
MTARESGEERVHRLVCLGRVLHGPFLAPVDVKAPGHTTMTRNSHEGAAYSSSAQAAKLGVGIAERVRTWVRKSQVDTGRRPGVTSEEAAEIKRARPKTHTARCAESSRSAES